MIKCEGCGAFLQDEFPDKEGYTQNLNGKLCNRCFNIKHYNKYLKVPSKDYGTLIRKIDGEGELFLLVTDFLNLYNLDEINLKSPVILVITKADIFPRSINKDYFLKKLTCKLNVISKVIVSSKNNYHLDLLYDLILKYKRSDRVYVTGYTNGGKSTLVNKMLKNYGHGIEKVTVSNLPSTTLDLLEVKINDELTLIDTPGLLDDGSLVLKASKDVLNKICPKKEIRPISYQIKERQSLLIDDFLRLDLENVNIICYMSNELNYKRVYKKRDCLLKRYDLKIKKGEDLVIKGLGFISFMQDSEFTLWLIDGVEYIIRDSII